MEVIMQNLSSFIDSNIDDNKNKNKDINKDEDNNIKLNKFKRISNRKFEDILNFLSNQKSIFAENPTLSLFKINLFNNKIETALNN